MRFNLRGNKLYVLVICKLCNHFAFFALGKAIINELISNTVILKRHDKLVDNCITHRLGDSSGADAMGLLVDDGRVRARTGSA